MNPPVPRFHRNGETERVLIHPNPLPTEYRNLPGVAPDAWVGDNTLGNPVTP